MRSSLFLTYAKSHTEKKIFKKFGITKNGVILNQVERQTKQAERQTKNNIKKRIKKQN
nr:MAG TPA: hypothetical protein [Caudoviricetes sp.]